MCNYARSIAFIRKGNIREAQEELNAIETLKKDPEFETLIASANNASIHAANIAFEIVYGELEVLKGNIPKAI